MLVMAQALAVLRRLPDCGENLVCKRSNSYVVCVTHTENTVDRCGRLLLQHRLCFCLPLPLLIGDCLLFIHRLFYNVLVLLVERR